MEQPNDVRYTCSADQGYLTSVNGLLLFSHKYETKRRNGFTAAIIGAGRVGEYHTRAQIALGSSVIIFDPDLKRAKLLAKKHARVAAAASLDAALERVDVVHICTPPMYHREGALASIAHGKPTIIEKPLAFRLNDALDIYRAARSNDVTVILGTSFRMAQSFREIYNRVRCKEIGKITDIASSYVHDTKNLEPGKTWRKQLAGPAFIYEGGSHAVDVNMWLAGQPVFALQACAGGKKNASGVSLGRRYRNQPDIPRRDYRAGLD